ncbi:hypothetical protein L596_011115 [Steinernema carpocapsae]|uniref:C2H2-type domain-containing protein n=1 Tax=Steinernema carpocapsae TaxID=34508 RepID=A0A4U5NSA9_STECR|nr:hypothetical protein L596_011115 [Steinernema carpocapsae]
MELNGSAMPPADGVTPFSSNRNHFGFLTAAPSSPNHPFMHLTCCECGIEKPGCEELEIHIKIEHLNWLPFVCPICQTSRASDSQLREHIYSAHKKNNTSKYIYMDNPKAKQLLLVHMDNSLAAYCSSRAGQNSNSSVKSLSNGTSSTLLSEISSVDSNPKKRKPSKPVINNETGEVTYADEATNGADENGFPDLVAEGMDADCFGLLSSVLSRKPKKEIDSDGENDAMDDNDFKSTSFLNDISQLFQGDKTAIDVLVHPTVSAAASGQKRRVMNPKGSQKGGTSKKRVLGLCSRCQKPVTAGGRQMHVFFHMGKDQGTYRFRCQFDSCDAEHYRKDQMEAHMVKVHGGIRADLIEDRAGELNERAQELSVELLGTSTNAPGPTAELAQKIYDQQMQEQLDRDDVRSRKKQKLMTGVSAQVDSSKAATPDRNDDDDDMASTSVLTKKEIGEGDGSEQMIECQLCKKTLINRIRGFHILWHMARDLGISRYACRLCDFGHDRSQAVQRHGKQVHGEDSGCCMDTINQHEEEIKMMSQKCFGIDALFQRDSKKKGGKFPLLSNVSSPSKENCQDELDSFVDNGDLTPGNNDLDHDVVMDEETGEEPGSESGHSESQNDSDSEE